MTTENANQTTTPEAPIAAEVRPSATPVERKTLRVWLEENDPPAGLTSDICPMRSLVALACTIEGYDPGTAARTLVSRDELDAMMRAARKKHLEILAENQLTAQQEHHAPILPAKSLMVAFIIKRPTAGQINSLNTAIIEGANAAAAEDGGGLKLTHMTRLLNQCVLFPPPEHRQRIFLDYGGLQLEMSNKTIALGSKAVEEIVGK